MVIPNQIIAHKIRYLCFHYYNWDDTSVGGLLSSESIIHPGVSVPTLTWFIRYIYYWNSHSS